MKKTSIVSLATLLFSSASAFAQAGGSVGDKGYYALGMGIMLGLGALGATLGEGRVGGAAMEGLARNPQARNTMFVPMIVVLALIESLFILTWLVANGVSGKL